MRRRSSKRHRIPHKTPEQVTKRIISLRWRLGLRPAKTVGRLELTASTVHAVLTRCEVNRLSHTGSLTGERLMRCEHPYPGSLVHFDVTKFGRIPDDSGWRFIDKQHGGRTREATARRAGKRCACYGPNVATGYVHTVVDDNSRFAYTEI